MAAPKIEVARLDIDVDALLKNQSEYLKQINALKQAQKDLRASGQESSAEFAKNDAALKNLNKTYRDGQKFAASLLAVNGDLNKTMSAENKNVLELQNNRRQLREIVKQINGDTEEEIQLRDRLNDAIDEQTEAIREQSSEFDASKDGIGEYQQAIEKAIPANTLIGRVISTTKDVLNIVTPLYKAYSGEIRSSVQGILNAARGTEGLTKAQKAQVIITNVATNALKLFRIALISTGIGAIVVALASLVAYLGSTQAGIDKVNRVLKPLEVIFGRLFGVLQQVGEALFNAFSDPQKLINDLIDLVKNNLETRFNAFIRILNRIKNFDFDGIGEDLVQAATGVENLGEKTRDFFNQAKGFIQDAIDLGQQLADIQVQIEENEIKLITRQAELNNTIKEQNKIAEDITKTQQEREAAALRSIDASKELLKLEQDQLDLKIKQKELENSINDTSREDQKELAELEAQRIEAATRAAELQTTQQNKLNTIRKEIADRAKKAEEERAQREREAAVEAVRAANVELEIFKEKNKEILEADGVLNMARIDAALSAERYIRDESLAILDDRLKKGLIKEDEAALERLKIQNAYGEREKELNAEFQKQKDDLLKEQQKKDEERRQLEEEARLELRGLQAEDEIAFRQIQLDAQREQELAAAEKLGADTTAIKEKFKRLQDQIDLDRRKFNVDQTQQTFGAFNQIAGAFFKENKGLSVALATADTFLSAQKAYLSQLIPGDPTSFGRAVLAAGAATATGLANVAQVAGVKFAKGGILSGARHSQGGIPTPFGEVEGGEIVLTRGVTKDPALRAFASMLNYMGGGRRFANGGILGSNNVFSQSGIQGSSLVKQMGMGIDYDKLAVAVRNGYASAPPPITDIRDFHEVNDTVNTIISGANV